ncbi:MAG TPA: ATP-binding protein, partial [Streptosporangiaceae bacterium]
MTGVARAPRSREPLTAPPADAESVPFRFDLAWLRGLVRERARAAGLTPRQVVDLVLAVGEAAANTVRHAGG